MAGVVTGGTRLGMMIAVVVVEIGLVIERAGERGNDAQTRKNTDRD